MSHWISNHSCWSGTRALHLAWPLFEVILLTTWRAQSLFGMSLRSTMSLVLGWHYISLQTPRDFQSIFLVFLITYLRRISIYSLPKLITKCMVVTPRSTMTASRCCWRHPRFKYRSWGRNIIFPLYLIHTSLLKWKRHWFLQCALAYATHISMLSIFSRGYSSRSLNLCTFRVHWPQTLLAFLRSVCRHNWEWKPLYSSEGTSQVALEIGH